MAGFARRTSKSKQQKKGTGGRTQAGARTKGPTAGGERAGGLDILYLQRTIGNQATIRLLRQQQDGSSDVRIQRLPSKRAIITELGAPKKNTRVLGRTVKKQATNYIRVLDAVHAVDQYVGATNVDPDPGGAMDQARQLNSLLDDVVDACDQ